MPIYLTKKENKWEIMELEYPYRSAPELGLEICVGPFPNKKSANSLLWFFGRNQEIKTEIINLDQISDAIKEHFVPTEYAAKNYHGNWVERHRSSTKYSIRTPEYRDMVTKKINNWNERSNYNTTFVFGTYEEAHLWIDECTGQISDGKYENTRNTQWEFLCHMRVMVVPGAQTHIEGYVPNHVHMSFQDLIWLFEGTNLDQEKTFPTYYDETDAREVFSKVRTGEIKGYLKSIGKALNAKGN